MMVNIKLHSTYSICKIQCHPKLFIYEITANLHYYVIDYYKRVQYDLSSLGSPEQKYM